MPCDRYEHLLNEGARAAASNPLAHACDRHSMLAISSRAVEAHLRHCDACRDEGREPSDIAVLQF